MLFNDKPDSISYDADMISKAIRNEYGIGNEE